MTQYRRRKPENIGSILESTLRGKYTANTGDKAGTRLDKKLEQYAAFPHWPEIVGEQVAAVSRPEKILGGKLLIVRVVDAVWAQELSLQKHTLLEKIQGFELGTLIEDIRFTIGNPKSFSKR